MKRPEEFASIEVRRVFSFDDFHILTVMPELSPLPDWSLIVDFLQASHEIVVKFHGLDHHAPAAGAPHILSCFLGKAFPPVLEVVCSHGGNVFPFGIERMSRRGVWQLLSKSK